MFAKRLFYVSAALLCLAAAYHLGASNATAQVTKGQVAAAFWSNNLTPPGAGSAGGNVVVTTSGDVYFNQSGYTTWVKAGNAITP